MEDVKNKITQPIEGWAGLTANFLNELVSGFSVLPKHLIFPR
jgi:hypothetical protein